MSVRGAGDPNYGRRKVPSDFGPPDWQQLQCQHHSHAKHAVSAAKATSGRGSVMGWPHPVREDA